MALKRKMQEENSVTSDDTLSKVKAELTCCICFQIVSFPIFFPCKEHRGCHHCIQNLLDHHKVHPPSTEMVLTSITPPLLLLSSEYKHPCETSLCAYSFPISCPTCRKKACWTLADFEHMKIDMMLVNIGKILDHYADACPYCQSTSHNNEHVQTCYKMYFKCLLCETNVPKLEWTNHVQTCFAYFCTICQESQLNRQQYQFHLYKHKIQRQLDQMNQFISSTNEQNTPLPVLQETHLLLQNTSKWMFVQQQIHAVSDTEQKKEHEWIIKHAQDLQQHIKQHSSPLLLSLTENYDTLVEDLALIIRSEGNDSD